MVLDTHTAVRRTSDVDQSEQAGDTRRENAGVDWDVALIVDRADPA